MNASEWEWFGHAGHHIAALWMRFHMCTKVGPYLISTVGEYVHPSKSGGSERTEGEWLAENWPGEDIGAGRKYETYVFNVTEERCAETGCGCKMPVIQDWREIECRGANYPGDAAENHMEMCLKYAEMSERVFSGMGY